MKTKQIKIIELFGGIGSCTEALKRLGFNVNVADYVEIDKFAVAVNSDTQLYKQAGNSIVVNVLMAILENLLFKEFKKDRLF